MRFAALDVPAFGPFTGLRLEFPAGSGDLHVVYGANEAGKSSLLRAMHHLLFGIPLRTPDDHRHKSQMLRIGATLENGAGERLVCVRRVGRKDTLQGPEDGPLPDGALARFLAGVDEPYFSSMFGLGARELRDGAEELLRGQGNLGLMLFSANLGGAPVQKILEGLRDEAERLFKGRATTQVEIRPAVKLHEDLSKRLKDAVLAPQAWREVEDAVAARVAEESRLKAELGERRARLEWLSRCRDAWPNLTALLAEETHLASLPSLPEVGPEFPRQARAAVAALASAERASATLAQQAAKTEADAGACQVNVAVLDHAGEIEGIHQALGGYRERLESMAESARTVAGLEAGLKGAMVEQGLTGEIGGLRALALPSAVVLSIQQAAQRVRIELAALEEHRKLERQREAEATKLERSLADVPEVNVEALRAALAVAAEATEAARRMEELEAEAARSERELAAQCELVAGGSARADDVVRWPVPGLATLLAHRDRLDGLRQEMASEEKSRQSLEQAAATTRADLGRLQRTGELPSEDSLRQARAHRDRGWDLVLAAWQGRGVPEELEPGRPLEVAYPEAVVRADEVVDALRRDADAVAHAEVLRGRLAELAREQAEGHARLAGLRERWALAERDWRGEWSACGVPVRSPVEMEEWRAQWERLRQGWSACREAGEELVRRRSRVARACERLAAALGRPSAEEFFVLYEEARQNVQQGEEAVGRRKALLERLKECRGEQERLANERPLREAAVEAARRHWQEQVRGAQLAGQADPLDPEIGLSLLEGRRRLLDQYGEWEKEASRLRAAADWVRGYEERVRRAAEALGINGGTWEALETALWSALGVARDGRTRRDQLGRELEKNRLELQRVRGEEAGARQTLGVLLRQLGLESSEQLEPVLADIERRAQVRLAIDTARRSLAALARGERLETFMERVRRENPDELVAEEVRLRGELAAGESQWDQVRESLRGARERLREMENAGAVAAGLRQDLGAVEEQLARAASRFVRLRLAGAILENQIERYREANQGPLLRRSGEMFAAVTRGAFAGLKADFGADDVPVLVGLRPDGTKVRTEGMSEGTRDQLYLALRLAALERHVEEHEPMPLILDDLLITFDDDRVRAILPVLRDLSRRAQVFLFTHHRHMLELCAEVLPPGEWHRHELRAGPT